MIKLGVMADSHRKTENIRKALKSMDDCKYIIHLGDHDSDMIEFSLREDRLLTVPGNCDPDSYAPYLRIFKAEDIEVLMTHGNDFHVKINPYALMLKAREKNCALALYGHTHVQNAQEAEGVTLLNPGALWNGDYAIVTVDGSKISWEFKKV